MNTWLWIAQGVLAAFFAMAGAMKVLRGEIPNVSHDEVSANQARFIGIAELAGAIGLILPMLLDIIPWVTILAAGGLLLVMVAAIAFHIPRREYQVVPFNVAVAAILVFVIVGRWDLFSAA